MRRLLSRGDRGSVRIACPDSPRQRGTDENTSGSARGSYRQPRPRTLRRRPGRRSIEAGAIHLFLVGAGSFVPVRGDVMRWFTVSAVAAWVGGESLFLAFLWQPWLVIPGAVLLIAGLVGMAVLDAKTRDTPSRPGLRTQIAHRVQLTYEGRVEQFGAEHPETLRFRDILVHVYLKADLYDEAISHSEANLADAERILGHDHGDTLQYRDSLAQAYRGAGRIADAVRVGEHNVVEAERVLGLASVDALSYRHSLAVCYDIAGQSSEAIGLFERNILAAESEQNHVGAMRDRNGLARVFEKAGRSGEAISLYERNVAEAERMGIPDYSESVVARNGLAAAQADERFGM